MRGFAAADKFKQFRQSSEVMRGLSFLVAEIRVKRKEKKNIAKS